MTDTTDIDSNVFKFPNSQNKAAEPGESGPPFAAGSFLDQHGPGLFGPVENLNDPTLDLLLKKFRQHRALCTMLITLMEDEQASRAPK